MCKKAKGSLTQDMNFSLLTGELITVQLMTSTPLQPPAVFVILFMK